jgi:hypothetical protein
MVARPFGVLTDVLDEHAIPVCVRVGMVLAILIASIG